MKKLGLVISLVFVTIICMALVRKPVTAASELLILRGASVCNATAMITNTFSPTFSAAPTVVVCQIGLVVSSTNTCSSITTSNFVYTAAASVSNSWIAIGPP